MEKIDNHIAKVSLNKLHLKGRYFGITLFPATFYFIYCFMFQTLNE